jgi:hypothetical protein
MVRSFLLNQASREEGEELDRFALGRDALCAARRGKRATEGAAHDRHAVGGVLRSAVEEQGGRGVATMVVHALDAPWTERGEGRVDAVHRGSRSKPMDQSCRFTMSQVHEPATRLKSI